MHIFRKSTNTNAFGAYSYFGVTPEGHVYHWLMIHNAQLGDKFDPRTARVEIVGLARTQGNISPAKVDQFMADTLARPFNGTPPTPIKRTTRRSYGQPWRGLLIEALIDNSGYGGRRCGEGSPISYNVALDHVKADYESVRTLMLSKFPETADYPPYPVDEWEDDVGAIYNWAVEDVQRGVTEDGWDTYRMMSPAVAKRFSLSADTIYDATFSLEGRGGKHLCITHFEGQDLAGVDLAEALQDQTADKNQEPYNAYTNDWCRALLAMMSEWDVCFTSRKASDEVNYQLAFRMMTHCEALQDAAEAAAIEAAHVQEWAERDVVTTTTTKE